MKLITTTMSGKRLLTLALMLLTTYLTSVIGILFFIQSELNNSQQRELDMELSSSSLLLENLFRYAKYDIENLATSEEVTTLVSNTASGMSLRYGLSATIFRLNQFLLDEQQKQRINNKLVYSRLSFISFDGTFIADTTEIPFDEQPIMQALDDSTSTILKAIVVEGVTEIALIKNVYFAEKPFGRIVVFINQETLKDALTNRIDYTSKTRYELTHATGIIHLVDTYSDFKYTAKSSYLTHSITDTPFNLSAWSEPINKSEIFTSYWFISGFSIISIPIIMGIFYILFASNISTILETRVRESQKQERLLNKKNEDLIKEVSRRVESEMQLEYQATHDSLTNLPNRFYVNNELEERLDLASQNESKLAVIFIDLDNFKSINDTRGHLFGDQILQSMACQLCAAKKDNHFLARFGGDEFVLIASDIESKQAVATIAEDLLALFGQQITIDNETISVTASIGVALYPDDGSSAQQLLSKSDMAMYNAKKDGRNSIDYYRDSVSIEVNQNFHIENRLRLAVKNESLDVYYQPIVNQESNTICAAEAHIIWEDAILGAVEPEVFLPIAEKCGLIHQISNFVFTESCNAAKTWQSCSSIKLHINTSCLPLKKPDMLLDYLSHALVDSGLKNNMVTLEVSETIPFYSIPNIATLFDDLSERGVNLLLDNFGSGYSSLSFLKNYPFTTLKLKSSYTANETKDQSEQLLIKALIDISNILGLKITIQGIDTPEQLCFIKSIKCDSFQGDAIGKAMNKHDFYELLATSLHPKTISA
ncbi:putative bifunctional diguanylate cyclase/phosphodiesterase [Vibrio nomapromontoriensis]|uniref:putative bifunctional diguanylate cyclase/phosphodiesterase n=1 Tax=Vibrio nomapromontoriensis TaxID=2910246 RepID=UPI003D09A23E